MRLYFRLSQQNVLVSGSGDAMKRILFTAAIFFIPVSLMFSYATSPATFIPTDDIKRDIGVVRVCPSEELLHDVRLAVDEWNKAITFFSIRYLWPELLGLRLEVSDEGCDVNIMLDKTPERVNGFTALRQDNGRLRWSVVISDRLSHERRLGVIVHELSHVLGLLDSISSNAPYRLATDTSGLGKVTSHDVYALFVKYARNGDGVLVRPPPYIAYMTVDGPLPDVASAVTSVFLAFVADRVIRRLRSKPNQGMEHDG